MRSLVVLALVVGCGGGDKKVSEPEPTPVGDDDSGDTGPDLVDPEVHESIRRTFERKSGIVGRCFVEGLDAGEVKKTDRVIITLDATISPSGQASEVTVREASKRSAAIEACIVDMVKGWSFAEPPRPVKTSFNYVLERL